ncbi:MAG: hypothetical protein J5I91_00295 [Bacteroidetes bacterium]|nr:hypothetical protein [Bacteroidota bacterium]
MPENSSCLDPKPMIKLGNGENLPILNYNLPQTTSFVANVYLPVPVDAGKFKPNYTNHPPSGESYYDKVQTIDTVQLTANIANSFAGVVATAPASMGTEVSQLSVSPLVNIADAATLTLAEVPTGPVLDIKVAGMPVDQVAELSKNAMPVITTNLAGHNVIQFRPKPATVKPEITIVEHYRVNTYLGRYGAGETVKTFSLLPGEKTTISIKTYKQTVTNKRDVQNVLDSFSDESASDLETIAEQESNTHTKSSTNVAKKVSGGLSLPLPKISVSASASYSKTTNSEREESIKTLNRALSKQTQKSVSNRKVEVNTETSTTSTESEESTVTRVLENLNKSRTLNFVFRQLNQELITITYLDDVTFVFSNGYEEKKIVTKIDGLLQMLEEVMTNPADALVTFQEIVNQLGNVYDYEDATNPKSFLEKYTENIWDFFNHTPSSNWPPANPPIMTTTRFRKAPNLVSNYVPYGGAAPISVRGIIKNVTHRVLPTDSVIVDSILGQGEALDCFNLKAQDNIILNAKLDNDIKQQSMDIIEAITDPVEKAAMYKKVFGDCCDVPQSGGYGCNCGSTDNPTNPET